MEAPEPPEPLEWTLPQGTLHSIIQCGNAKMSRTLSTRRQIKKVARLISALRILGSFRNLAKHMLGNSELWHSAFGRLRNFPSRQFRACQLQKKANDLCLPGNLKIPISPCAHCELAMRFPRHLGTEVLGDWEPRYTNTSTQVPKHFDALMPNYLGAQAPNYLGAKVPMCQGT